MFFLKQNKTNKRSERKLSFGFTLVEIITAIGIFIIIFGVLTGFITWVYHSAVQMQATSEVENSFQQAMEAMLREIKRSRSIYVPTSNASQLSLETIDYTPTDEITSFIDFFLCGDQICFKKEGVSPVALTSQKVKVDSFSFNYLSPVDAPPSVQISLALSYKNPSGSSSLNFSVEGVSSASLRIY